MSTEPSLGEVSTKPTMCCPSCHARTLATIEALTGYAGVTVYQDGTADFAGATEVQWGWSRTIGVCCRSCDWTYEGQDWRKRLVPSPEVARGQDTISAPSPLEL